tara:strand:- start:70 stop:750 length:681 start_codon:yes stop_codon:yes gene_type:complete
MNICIIPARGGSEGIKDKNIYPLLGKPLIQWTIEQAQYSKKIDEIFVTTDSSSIKKISQSLGAKTIDRPEEISGALSSSESALKHALKQISEILKKDIKNVIFLQATSPLRLKEDIDNAIDLFERNKADSLFSSSRMEDLTVWQNKNENWESINFDYLNRGRRQDIETNYIENGSIYIFKPNILYENNNRLGGKIESYIMNSWQYHEIDVIEDLEIVEFFLKKYIS